jgi:hypothetical protein
MPCSAKEELKIHHWTIACTKRQWLRLVSAQAYGTLRRRSTVVSTLSLCFVGCHDLLRSYPRHSYVTEFIQVLFGQGRGSLALSSSIANTLFIHSPNAKGALLWSTASRPGAGLFFRLIFNRLYFKLARMGWGRPRNPYHYPNFRRTPRSLARSTGCNTVNWPKSSNSRFCQLVVVFLYLYFH